MDWQKHIHSDPATLNGKPVVIGTRLFVEFLLNLFAAGWTEQQVLENYPNLTQESLRAVFAYAAESMSDEIRNILKPDRYTYRVIWSEEDEE